MRTELTGSHWTLTLDSLDELADAAERHYEECQTTYKGTRYGQSFLGVAKPRDALPLARMGWEAELPAALAASDRCVSELVADNVIQAFVPTFDVTGCEIEMGRFLSDEPECMVDYPLTEIVKAGKVITLVAGTGVSAAISTESIIRRGQVVVALALALSKLGYGVEIWTDGSMSSGRKDPDSDVITVRTCIKGTTDLLDPARIMFALSHPAMQRCLTFAAAHEGPSKIRNSVGVTRQGNYGYPLDPFADQYPDGAVILPAVLSGDDIADLDADVMTYLRDLDLVTE